MFLFTGFRPLGHFIGLCFKCFYQVLGIFLSFLSYGSSILVFAMYHGT